MGFPPPLYYGVLWGSRRRYTMGYYGVPAAVILWGSRRRYTMGFPPPLYYGVLAAVILWGSRRRYIIDGSNIQFHSQNFFILGN